MEISISLKSLKGKKGWLIVLLIGSVLLVGPILMVFVRLFSIEASSIAHLTQNLLPTYLINTLIVTIGVSLLTLLLGVGSAWVVSTCEFPFRKTIEWLLILPLAIPTFINAISYSGLTDYAGPIRIFLRSLGFDLYLDIMTIWGVIFVMSMVLYPYVYLTSRAAFLGQSGSMIEASRTLGLSVKRTFLRIALPTAWPAIFSGLSLVIMEVLNDYGTVKYFGVPTFTTGIFRSWLSLGDLPAALFLSAFTVILVLIILIAEEKSRGRKRYAEDRNQRQISRYQLKGWPKLIGFVIVLTPLLFGFIIPVFQMGWWLSLTYDKTVWSVFYKIAGNSILLGIFSSVLVVLIGLLMAYSQRKIQPKGILRYLSKMTVLGYAMPGAVIAIGIIAAVLFIDSSLLYAGAYALILGYVVRFFAVGFNPLSSGFQQQSLSMDDAATTMGIRPFRALTKIHLPLLKPSLIAGLLMVFVDVTKELPLTLILRPFNFETLATHAFQYATDEMAPESAAASLLIIFVGAVPIYLLNQTLQKRIS